MRVNPFTISGRISKQGWWFYSSVLTMLSVFDMFTGTGFTLQSIALTLVMIWVGICVNVKRYHDINKSGFWVLIGIIPVVGAMWIVAELGFINGDKKENRFGPVPKRGDVDEAPSRYAEMSDEEFRQMARNAHSVDAPKALPSAPVVAPQRTVATTTAPVFGRRGVSA